MGNTNTRQYLLRKIKTSVCQIDRCLGHLKILELAYKDRFAERSYELIEIQHALILIRKDIEDFYRKV